MEVKSQEHNHVHGASTSGLANAMAHISVYCADKMKAQFEINQNGNNSNYLLETIGTKVRVNFIHFSSESDCNSLEYIDCTSRQRYWPNRG